jgi:hypothetical protein
MKRLPYSIIAKIAIISLFTTLLFPIRSANASVTQVIYRPDRHSTGSAPSGSACIETTTSGTESELTIVFPSTFTLDETASNWAMDTTANNIPTSTTQWPSTDTGNANTATDSSKTVVFTVGDVSASALTCMHFTATGTSTNGAAGDDRTGSIATNIDSAISYATSIVSSGGDLIGVSATVPALFTFSLGSTTAALGTLSNASVTSATGITATASTNARLGWSMWVKNSTNGLYSTNAATAIPAPGAFGSTYDISSGNTGYGLDVNTGSGTPTIDAAYNGTGDASYVGVLQSTFQPIATKATPGDSDTVTLRFRSRVTVTQPAASDYADTVTVVAAGNY